MEYTIRPLSLACQLPGTRTLSGGYGTGSTVVVLPLTLSGRADARVDVDGRRHLGPGEPFASPGGGGRGAFTVTGTAGLSTRCQPVAVS